MPNVFSSGLAAIGLGVGVLGGSVLVPDGPGAVIHLSVEPLVYVEINGQGAVTQRIKSSRGVVPADWRARIERVDSFGFSRIICEGSGQGNYSGEVNTWSLDDWTGGDCPDVAEVGDIFEVSWAYQDENGWPVVIGGRFQLEPNKTLQRVSAQ